jgi:peptide/nickel transport system substrate-binding protein
VGQNNVNSLDTANGYLPVSYGLDRAISRQLYTWPTAPTLAGQVNPVPDMATAMPKITNGGKTYTVTIRSGVKWDTNPPRRVTAADEVLGMKRLCNPASPTEAPGYFESTILGMQSYCSAFSLVAPDAASIKTFIETHTIQGVKAIGTETVQFTLTQPSSDFIDVLSLPFSSPVPVEELSYVPGSLQLAQHFVSDGPYTIRSYVPGTSFDLVRNPAWEPSADPIRNAYVNEIKVTEGVASASAALQEVQAGTADLLWGGTVPTASLPGKIHDPDLVIGPGGSGFSTIDPFISINLQSPNNHGALRQLYVREALEYAINKSADSQIAGGSAVSGVLNQVVPPGSAGHIAGYDPYPTAKNQGDPAQAKTLLAKAGYSPGQITLNFLYWTNAPYPQLAQSDQAALQASGFKVNLVGVTPGDAMYSNYLGNPHASTSGAWDIAETSWAPDWLGNNGRTLILPLFDGQTYGQNSADYGDYDNEKVNNDVAAALATASSTRAMTYWQAAAKQVMADAVVVPIGAQKVAVYHSSRVQGCDLWFASDNCDFTNVWLKG